MIHPSPQAAFDVNIVLLKALKDVLALFRTRPPPPS